MALPYWSDGEPLLYRLFVRSDIDTFGLDYWADGQPLVISAAPVFRKLAFYEDCLAKSLFDAHSVVAATSDNTPVAIVLAEERILGRKTGGNIDALSPTEILTMLDAAPVSDWLVDQVFS